MSEHPSAAGEDFDDPVDEYRQAARTPKPWPELTRPTPAQYLPWFLEQPTADQLGILTGLFAEVEAADRCRWSGHDAAVALMRDHVCPTPDDHVCPTPDVAAAYAAGQAAALPAARAQVGAELEALLDQSEAGHRKASGQRACTCGGWHWDDTPCPKGGTQIMATGSEGWDL